MERIITANAVDGLKTLPDSIVDMCVTSPPYYGLRDYGVDGQIGLEDSPDEYIKKLVAVFREVKRVLKSDGTLWLNIGDSYAGSGRGKGDIFKKGIRQKASYVGDVFDKPYRLDGYKNKDLIGIPWMLAFALRADGWYLRQDILWYKPNPLPESVLDRCTKAHEYIFLLSKSPRYYFNNKAIMEKAAYDGRNDTRAKDSHKYSQPGVTGLKEQTFAAKPHERWQRDEEGNYLRNKRSVWTVNTRPYREAHFAVYPPDLIRPCVLAGSHEGGIVLDPFFGTGTTGVVAIEEGRGYIGIELNPSYVELAQKRLKIAARQLPLFNLL